MLETWIQEENLSGIDTDQNYQLNIEDAERISGFDLVIFVDASVHDIKSTLIEKISPDFRADFSMHSVEPAFVVGLCHQMFNDNPECYQMHMFGSEQ